MIQSFEKWTNSSFKGQFTLFFLHHSSFIIFRFLFLPLPRLLPNCKLQLCETAAVRKAIDVKHVSPQGSPSLDRQRMAERWSRSRQTTFCLERKWVTGCYQWSRWKLRNPFAGSLGPLWDCGPVSYWSVSLRSSAWPAEGFTMNEVSTTRTHARTWTNEQTNKWTNERSSERTIEWTNDRTNDRTNKRTSKQTDERTYQPTNG